LGHINTSANELLVQEGIPSPVSQHVGTDIKLIDILSEVYTQ